MAGPTLGTLGQHHSPPHCGGRQPGPESCSPPGALCSDSSATRPAQHRSCQHRLGEPQCRGSAGHSLSCCECSAASGPESSPMSKPLSAQRAEGHPGGSWWKFSVPTRCRPSPALELPTAQKIPGREKAPLWPAVRQAARVTLLKGDV